MLTHRQTKTLQFIIAYQTEHGGASPTFEEIMHGVGFASKSSVSRQLEHLEERGFIRRFKNLARGIEVIRKLPHRQRPPVIEELHRQIEAGDLSGALVSAQEFVREFGPHSATDENQPIRFLS